MLDRLVNMVSRNVKVWHLDKLREGSFDTSILSNVHTHYHYGNVSDLSSLRILLADTNLNSTSSSEYGCGWAVGPRGTLNMEIKEISYSNYFTLMDCYDSRYIA